MDKPYTVSQNITLGERIKNFRQRAGISQFNLEIEIGAAPGSLSRIEAGKVNPSKETLLRIINALNLKSFEAMTLFDLKFDELPRMVKLAKKLSSSLDVDEVLQYAVNEIVYELNLLGSVIMLQEDNYIYAKAMTQTWATKLIHDLLPKPLRKLRVSILKDPDNYVVKTIILREPQYSTVFSNFAKGCISIALADAIQKFNGTKCTLCLPIEANNKVFGAILFSKDIVDGFKFELNILQVFAEYIGTAILNAQKYQLLQEEVLALKKESAVF